MTRIMSRNNSSSHHHHHPPHQHPPHHIIGNSNITKSRMMFDFSSNSNSNIINFDSWNTAIQFTVLVIGVFVFFGIHNYLQEAIMRIDGFHSYGVMLGYFEVLGVSVCSYIERTHVRRERGRTAPLSAYPLLTLCLVSSSALSNMSLNYINFPTKVVFRSCKLIPTMIIASIIHSQIYTPIEYISAAAACLGLIMFAAADWNTSPSFHPIGLALVSTSVCADAVLPNAQERLFKTGSSRLEVTFYTNIFVLSIMTLSTYLSGDLIGSLRLIISNHTLKVYFLIYTFIAHVAISFHMSVVKRYGGVVSVLVATGRKAMTLIVSFIVFPKTFSYYYPIGAILVLGGLTMSSLYKVYNSKNPSPTATTAGTSTSTSSSTISTINTNDIDDNAIETKALLLRSHSTDDVECDHNHNNSNNNGR